MRTPPRVIFGPLNRAFLCLLPAPEHLTARGSLHRRTENVCPLHVHRHRDKLEAAAVSIEAEIAKLPHPAPIIHRRVGTLNADANARGRLVDPYLPIDQQLVALDPVGDPIVAPQLLKPSRSPWLS